MPRYSYVIVFLVLIVLCIGINIQRYPAVSSMLQGNNIQSHYLGRAEFLGNGKTASSQTTVYQASDDNSSTQKTKTSYNSLRSSRDPIPVSVSSDLQSKNSEYDNETLTNSRNFGTSKTLSQLTQDNNDVESKSSTNKSYDDDQLTTSDELSKKYHDDSNSVDNDYSYGKETTAFQNTTEYKNDDEDETEYQYHLENDSSTFQSVPDPLTMSLSEPPLTLSSTSDFLITQNDMIDNNTIDDSNARSGNGNIEKYQADNTSDSQNSNRFYENFYKDKEGYRQNPKDASKDFYHSNMSESHQHPTVFHEAAPLPGYFSHVTSAETISDTTESLPSITSFSSSPMEDTHRNSVIVPNRKTLSAQEKLELRQATPFVLQAVNANKNDSVNEYIPPDFLSNLDQPTKRLPIPTTELTTTIIPPEFEKSSNSMDSNP